MSMTARTNRLDRLARGIRRCRRCRLHRNRTHAVPGEGPADAAWCLVGEAPGRREDEQGRPFAGAAGRYLDALLSAHGLARDMFFITSCVKCRPPGNRNPRGDELDVCGRVWLERQVHALSPSLVILMGAVAASRFVDDRPVLKSLHGRVYEIDGRRYFVTYHPAAAMRFPAADRGMHADFRKLAGLRRS